MVLAYTLKVRDYVYMNSSSIHFSKFLNNIISTTNYTE